MKKLFLLFILMLSQNSFAQTSIAGVKFGSSYETAKQLLISKFGEPDLIDANSIMFCNKMYAGETFNGISFGFIRDGAGNSFLNSCVLVEDAKTLKDAIEFRDQLASVIGKSYEIDTLYDSENTKYYRGGVSPVDSTKYAFLIDVVKY